MPTTHDLRVLTCGSSSWKTNARWREFSEVADHLAVLVEEKKQRILVEGNGEVIVDADRFVLRQAVINLYDNAIKYSPEGSSIHVSIRAEDRSAVLEVRDCGIGIPRDSQKHVSERFYRVDKGRSRELGGTGLGLSIARWAVEVHGGQVGVDSEVGEGSTFRVVLPLARAEPRPKDPDEEFREKSEGPHGTAG